MTRTDQLVDAVLDAARVLVAISVRSLAATGDVVTVSQLRVLMLVAGRAGVNVADVAAELGVHRSNATRVVDRLVRAGLLGRRADPADRRRLVLELTVTGRNLVADVDAHRRDEIAAVLGRIPPAGLDGAEAVWRAFADAG
ncbi:MarR family winged helix-turn-helix transcriptional regulator [Pseudonocardia endophytica]|uniref:MarR family transcriptional regulator n=1 Tax=Pseudonocardia endophytica TaxID=401976 RepID=A0A4R1HVV0_PSEEN|nr:MarR family winged helix-turn-helix transcriptional regulator [Pseudonocardia endophytica]TCK21632.1 MarR family transcriptional regulator [Pseudonocardia endophytica]